jgi:hypothetical protein
MIYRPGGAAGLIRGAGDWAARRRTPQVDPASPG